MNFEEFLKATGLACHPYQVEGVKWMLKNEVEGNLICDKYNIRGGMLCDEMGLGKTIQMLGVIMENFNIKTLIVLPLALLNQWAQIIKKKVGHTSLIYHGAAKKKITLAQLNEAPIVLTTYGEISIYENKKKESSLLHQVNWYRLVFDEAHHLRNKSTGVHNGALNLKTTIRWLMTGTPIQNSKQDFYSLCSVLGVPSVYYAKKENLVSFVKAFILRRTKESIGLKIPEVITQYINTEWTNSSEMKCAVNIHKKAGLMPASMPNPTENSISDVLNLQYTIQSFMLAKQACIYPPLMKSRIAPFVKKIKKCTECPVCLEHLEHLDDASKKNDDSENSPRRLKLCDHVFHKKCIEAWLATTNSTCPLCRTPVTSKEEVVSTLEVADMAEAMTCASKIDAVINMLIARQSNGNAKIVFCHYVGEIDVINERLTAVGMNVVIIDGRFTQKERHRILTMTANYHETSYHETSKDASNAVIILIQIQTGCEGLNLQWCNEIYFVSPHWNPSVEDQAVSRCHRMGQEKPVFVFKFVMQTPETSEIPKTQQNDAKEVNTLDQYCIQKQMEKRAIMEKLYEITNDTE